MEALERRFWTRVQKADGCWLWTASKNGAGYGQLSLSGKPHGAHRVSWGLHHGPIPEGLCVLHKCDVRECVNPDHLFLGTVADNAGDMVAKGRHARTGASGEANGQAKLTVEDVRIIRSRQGQSQRTLAKEFGVSQRLISHVRSRAGWTHI